MSPWAKLSEAGRLSVAAHGRDVAASFSALCAAPGFSARLSVAAGRPLTSVDLARLGVLAFLHDYGKCNRGFQARIAPKAPRIGHCEQAVPALQPEIAAQAPEVDGFWEEIHAGWNGGELLAAMLAHHGRPLRGLYVPPGDQQGDKAQDMCLRSDARYWRAGPDRAPLDDLHALMQEARALWPRAFDESAPPLPGDRPAFVALFAGLLTLADWIGSDETLFPVPRPEGWAAPEAIAAQAVEARGLARLTAPAPSDFSITRLLSLAASTIDGPRSVHITSTSPERSDAKRV